jgi:hypothetical protein
MERELREARFRAMAEQNGLEYDPRRGFGVVLDMYEYALRQIRQSRFARFTGFQIPRDLLIGSAMGWLYERILGFEKGEEERKTKRQEAESKHQDLLFEAAIKQLHQWIPQPVPDDFACPYTGDAVDKRKILATGARHKKVGKSTVYDGHNTLVIYRTGHRGQWYVAREIWDGGRDHHGNRSGVQIEKVPFGEVTMLRKLGSDGPGIPYRGTTGYSGQPGRPSIRMESGPRPSLDEDYIIPVKSGYHSEADARKQAMLWILSPHIRGDKAEIMGRRHVNLRRASRMRGGARQGVEVMASAPYQTETPMERLSPTLPAHPWGGEIVEAKAPLVHKERRKVKDPADSEEIRSVIRNNRQRAMNQNDSAHS